MKHFPEQYYGSPWYFLRFVIREWPVPWKKMPLVLAFFLRSMWVYLPGLFERFFLASRIQSTRVEHPPIFILGHYRSGTTLMQKILAAHPDWSAINLYDLMFPHMGMWWQRTVGPILQALLRLFRVKNTHFDSPMLMQDPAEEDLYLVFNLSPLSPYWGIAFPNQYEQHLFRNVDFPDDDAREQWKAGYLYLIKKFTRKWKGKRLVSKTPPNTGRVGALLELFPDAKFIYLYRNPYHLYLSMDSMFRKSHERFYCTNTITDEQRETIIFSQFRRLLTMYETQRALIPPENLIELRYEDFIEDPKNAVRFLFEQWRLPDYERAAEGIHQRLEMEKTYVARQYQLSEAVRKRIEDAWGPWIDRWGYGGPEGR